MRVYLPGTLALLREWAHSGVIGPAPLTAFADTPGLRAWCGSEDDEELEYAAQQRAAEASLLLLGPAEDPVRVVLAVDVPGAQEQDRAEVGAVVLSEPVAWRSVAAGLVVEGDDLLWYATQELADL